MANVITPKMLKALQIAEMHDRFFAYAELKQDTGFQRIPIDTLGERFYILNQNLCVALGITPTNLVEMYLLRM